MARTATSSGQMLSSSPASEVVHAEDNPLVQPEAKLPVALQPVEVAHAGDGHLPAEEVALGKLVEDGLRALTGAVRKLTAHWCAVSAWLASAQAHPTVENSSRDARQQVDELHKTQTLTDFTPKLITKVKVNFWSK